MPLLLVKLDAVINFPEGGLYRELAALPNGTRADGYRPPYFTVFSVPQHLFGNVSGPWPDSGTVRWRVDFERLPDAMKRLALSPGFVNVLTPDWPEFAYALRLISDDSAAPGASGPPSSVETFASLRVVRATATALKAQETSLLRRIAQLDGQVDVVRVPARQTERNAAWRQAQGKPFDTPGQVSAKVAVVEASATDKENELAAPKTALETTLATVQTDLAAEQASLGW